MQHRFFGKVGPLCEKQVRLSDNLYNKRRQGLRFCFAFLGGVFVLLILWYAVISSFPSV